MGENITEGRIYLLLYLRGEFNLRRPLKIVDVLFSLNGTRTDGFRKNEPHDGYCPRHNLYIWDIEGIL